MSSVQVFGVRELLGAFTRMGAQLDAASIAATTAAAHLVEERIKTQLGATSHERGTPTPAAPGSPPSLVTGTLRRSVSVTGPNHSGEGWVSEVGPTAVYSRVQDMGGVTGRGHRTRLPARPYVRPAYESAVGEIGGIFREAWSRALLA